MLSFFRQKRIYLDYAAATPVRAEALSSMREAEGTFGNPSAVHSDGIAAKEIFERAREGIAHTLQCRAKELVFTSGGTEGNNLAIFGSVNPARLNLAETHVVVSAIEHPSVLEPIVELERRGALVTRVAPDKHGRISPEAVAAALMKETKLVSVGWANSEIGVVQPLSAIAKVIRGHEAKHGTKIIFHTDAGQAPLYIKSTVHSLGVDLMTLDSGKLYGPRGIGALYIKHGVELRPTQFGGGQERGSRPGTENVTLATGFAAALQASASERDEESHRLSDLRTHFIQAIAKAIPDAVLNGDAKHSLPHIVNISIPNTDAEYIALALDHKGVSISTKTSCKEGERESAVVAALEATPQGASLDNSAVSRTYSTGRWRAASSLRFSLGRGTTDRELNRAVSLLADLVDNLKKHHD